MSSSIPNYATSLYRGNIMITNNFNDLIGNKYQVILADPPWLYYGDPNKNQAAGKHYSCMNLQQLSKLPVKSIAAKDAVLYMWATGPKLEESICLINNWGFKFRTVAHVWVKTTKTGSVIHGQGIRPSFVKQNAEYILVGSMGKPGRTLPLCSESTPQIVLHSRPDNLHSKKPNVFRDLVVETYGDVKRVELFCRFPALGWDAWGNEI